MAGMSSTRLSLLSAILLIALTVIVLFAIQDEENHDSRSAYLPESDHDTHGGTPERNGAALAFSASSVGMSDSVSNDLPVEVVQSIYELDVDSRNAAIAAIEKEASEYWQAYPDGWLRWQPVWINAFAVTNGDYLNPDAVESEFIVSPFPNLSYRATRTSFRPRRATASASWRGELDGGVSGVIEMSILATEGGPVLFMKLRTPDGEFSIRPTNVYGAYVSSETNVAFWQTQGPMQ